MVELFAMFLGQVITILFWSLLISTPVLKWRSKKLKNWDIKFKSAYVISIKAALISLILTDILALSVYQLLPVNDVIYSFIPLALLIFCLYILWYAHTNSLFKFSQKSNEILISIKDARSISTSVVLIILGIWFALGATMTILAITLGLLN